VAGPHARVAALVEVEDVALDQPHLAAALLGADDVEALVLTAGNDVGGALDGDSLADGEERGACGDARLGLARQPFLLGALARDPFATDAGALADERHLGKDQ